MAAAIVAAEDVTTAVAAVAAAFTAFLVGPGWLGLVVTALAALLIGFGVYMLLAFHLADRSDRAFIAIGAKTGAPGICFSPHATAAPPTAI